MGNKASAFLFGRKKTQRELRKLENACRGGGGDDGEHGVMARAAPTVVEENETLASSEEEQMIMKEIEESARFSEVFGGKPKKPPKGASKTGGQRRSGKSKTSSRRKTSTRKRKKRRSNAGGVRGKKDEQEPVSSEDSADTEGDDSPPESPLRGKAKWFSSEMEAPSEEERKQKVVDAIIAKIDDLERRTAEGFMIEGDKSDATTLVIGGKMSGHITQKGGVAGVPLKHINLRPAPRRNFKANVCGRQQQ